MTVKVYPLFSSKNFIVLVLVFISVSDPFWINFYIWLELGVELHFFSCEYPAWFVEQTILSLLNDLETSIKNQSTIHICVYFWTLRSISLICMSVLMPLPHYLHYCNFVASFEIWKFESSSFCSFQDCVSSFGPLPTP